MTDADGRLRTQMFSKAFNPTGDLNAMPPPPPSAGPTVSGRDAVLLKMQQALFKFYKKRNPENLRKSTLAVALQIWWDHGLVVLNHFLEEKYGKKLKVDEDYLDDFDRKGQDITLVTKPELNIDASNKHLMVKAMIKTNSANFFMMNKGNNTAMFERRQERRAQLGSQPVLSLLQDN